MENVRCRRFPHSSPWHCWGHSHLMEFVAVWVFFKFSTQCFTFSCNLQGADTKDNNAQRQEHSGSCQVLWQGCCCCWQPERSCFLMAERWHVLLICVLEWRLNIALCYLLMMGEGKDEAELMAGSTGVWGCALQDFTVPLEWIPAVPVPEIHP